MSNIDQMNLGPRWYVAHTYTGYEDKVKASIEKIVENRGLGHLIYEVQVPAIIEPKLDENGNPVFDEKTGEQKFTRIKLMPSYVLVKMTMTDESWHVVRNITGVTGFVGPGSEPTPLTDEEVAQLQVEKVETKVNDCNSDTDNNYSNYNKLRTLNKLALRKPNDLLKFANGILANLCNLLTETNKCVILFLILFHF